MKEIGKVKEVCAAHSKVIQAITGNKFIKTEAGKLPPFGKLWNGLAGLWNRCAGSQGLSLAGYFVLAHGRFSEDWLIKTFKRNYLPLAVATSQKTQDGVFKNWHLTYKAQEGLDRPLFYKSLLAEAGYSDDIIDDIVATIGMN